jgi:hypothetical protein
MIGTHAVVLTPMVGAAVDLSCLVDQVAIHYGRDDSDSQPEANAATLDLSTDTAETPFPPELEVGGIIVVTTTIPGHPPSTRFVGKVTDLSLGWDEAGAETPDRVTAQVIATGPLADYGRRVVGATPWPQQLDGARVAAVFAAANLTLNPATSDPGTVQIISRDVDSQPALDVAQGTATSAGGVVWSTPAGDVRYADANHRRNTVPALSLDACDVLVTPTWSRTTEALVNDVSIGYGVAAGGGEQPRWTGDRADSKDRFGTYGFTTATELAAASDAQALGTMLLTRNSSPVWVMTNLPVAVDDLDEADTVALLALEMHSLVEVTGLPAAGSVPTSTYLWVEGWSETLAWGVHDVELTVSGYCRTSPPPRWNDAAPALTWDTAHGTWDDAACLGPTPNLGRWDDVPATTRWDQVPPATTWDNYTPTTSGGR